MPPLTPCTTTIGKPASVSASTSRSTVRVETSSASANCTLVKRPRFWSSNNI
jgi:hypothetical protein